MVRSLAGGMIPGVLFCVMPKCPLCLAAWVSIATGLTLPFPVANGLHKSLIALCVASVLLSGVLFARSFVGVRLMRTGKTNVKNDFR
jgi:uncharacterized protein (DUF58 family)